MLLVLLIGICSYTAIAAGSPIQSNEADNWISLDKQTAQSLRTKPEEVHHVPSVSQAFIRDLLSVYDTQISLYLDEYNKMHDESAGASQAVEYARNMHNIFSKTDIAEAQRDLKASLATLKRTNATFFSYKAQYDQAKKELLAQKATLEEGMTPRRGWDISEKVIHIVTDLTKTLTAIFASNGTNIEKAANGTRVVVVAGADLTTGIAGINDKINGFKQVTNDVYNKLGDLEKQITDYGFMNSVEAASKFNEAEEKWLNFKRKGLELLSGPIEQVQGCLEYRRKFLDVCNWGIAVSKSTHEYAGLLKQFAKKRQSYDRKIETARQVEEAVKGVEQKNINMGQLEDAISEQTLTLKKDLSEALHTYCQARFYETLNACKENLVPNDSDSLDELRLKISKAIKNSFMDEEVPSSLHRVIIRDTNTNPSCSEVKECPVNYFRKTGTLEYIIDPSHPEFSDMDNYRVDEIEVDIKGIQARHDHEHVLLSIESSGEFKGRSKGVVRKFLVDGFSTLFEKNIVSGEITIHGRVAQEHGNTVASVTPFTTWSLKAVPFHSGELDFNNVNSIVLTMHGSAIDNEQ